MGLFNDMVDEKAVTEGIMLVANTILSRVQDEILTKKKIKVTVWSS
jgi:hypothetical protein